VIPEQLAMKVNFWQVLGIILLIAGVVLFARKKTATNDTVTPAAEIAPATTQVAP
jgi:drug/metabolite transporter (DMT)-like permease